MKWSKQNEKALIQYLTAQDTPTNLIARLMAFTRENADYGGMSVAECTDYLDGLFECVVCNEIEHEDFLTDVNGVGLTCVDCMR